jgi:Fe-S cluster biogenesis protein NfuA
MPQLPGDTGDDPQEFRMSVFGIRRRLKSGVKKALGMEDGPSDTAAPNWQNRPPETTASASTEDVMAVPEPQVAAAESEPEAVEEAAEAPVEAAVEASPAEAVEQAEDDVEVTETVETAGTDDVVGPPITLEAVQEILDDMVRPALQGDGGDISLLKVEDNNIYVKLVGACTTCPSSIMTMQMGVEALLREEFPSLNELVQVDAMTPQTDDSASAEATEA